MLGSLAIQKISLHDTVYIGQSAHTPLYFTYLSAPEKRRKRIEGKVGKIQVVRFSFASDAVKQTHTCLKVVT